MATLYAINQEYEDLLAMVLEVAEANEGVIPDNLADDLDQLEGSRDEKIENCIRYYKNELAIADMIKSEIDALRKRMQTHENAAKWCKAYVQRSMKEGEKREYGCGSIGWRKSEGVVIVNESMLPESCFKVERKPVLTAVKELLKANLFGEAAHIETRNNLQIK
jgi:hypothetical protein